MLTCPKCGSENSSTTDSRTKHVPIGRRRRRLCVDCGVSFSTIELRTDQLESLYGIIQGSTPKDRIRKLIYLLKELEENLYKEKKDGTIQTE